LVDVFTAVIVSKQAVPEQLWHRFLHFLTSCVSPSLLLCLSLSFKLTPFRSVFHTRLHKFCSYFYTWNCSSYFLCNS